MSQSTKCSHDLWAHVFQRGVAAIWLYTLLSLSPHLFQLWGTHGIVQHDAVDLLGLPTVQDVLILLSPLIDEWISLPAIYLALVISVFSLMMGMYNRASSLVSFLLTTLFFTGGHAHAYGVDYFRQTFLFLMVLMSWTTPSSQCFVQSASPPPAFRRFLQSFLAIVYVSSGLDKAFPHIFVDATISSCDQWLTGESIYRALLRPDLGQFDFTWLPVWLAKAIAWGTLILEIGFPFFVSFSRTRHLAAFAVVGMHLFIAVAMGLWTFSATMITAVSAAYLIDDRRLEKAQGDQILH